MEYVKYFLNFKLFVEIKYVVLFLFKCRFFCGKKWMDLF